MNAETATPDSLELAKDAINYVLERIQKDENIRYHMGAFTESFERLKAADSALNGISEEAIEQEIFSYQIKRIPHAKKVEAIKDLLARYDSRDFDAVALISKIKSVANL